MVSAMSPFKTTPDSALDLDAWRWEAVQSRCRDVDGRFVYAVRTTGIFCRPSCASRRPRRENVLFFADAQAAQTAGFRACMRCQPQAEDPVLQRHAQVARACEMLAASDQGVSLNALAAAVGLNPQYFHRVFKQVTGLTPKVYFQTLRRHRVQALLPGAPSVTQAYLDAGFNAASRFYQSEAAALGMSPSTYRKGGAGQTIQYTVAACSLGQVLVAATPEGVCAIEFDDDAAILIERLAQRFPKAMRCEGDARFQDWVGQVLSFIAHPADLPDLPLDIAGTVFQRKVWDRLRAIPTGQTVTYTELAAAIGQPSAVRAVARACASNEVALAIPCHRVIRSDGSLAGYRWGMARKASLLERERTVAQGQDSDKADR